VPLIVGPLPTVISPKPREEQPIQEPPPTQEPQPNQTVRQRAWLHRQEQIYGEEKRQQQRQTQLNQQSVIFYRNIGYPQYGGRYAPFDIPEGSKIESISETSAGLNVTFTSSEPYSQPVSPRKLFTELSEQEKQEFLGNPKKLFTDMSEQEKQVFLGNWPSPEQEAHEKALTEAIASREVSLGFYSEIGFPQYGGKYEPFVIPEGNKVESISETSKGLEIIFGFTEEQKQINVLLASRTYAETPSVIGFDVKKPYLSRWSELKDFGQDIANVKANAGTSSLSRTILGLQSQVPEVVKKYGIVGLGSPTAGLVMGTYEVAAFERLVNPYAPSLVEGLTSGKGALVGTLVGEAALIVIGGKVFSWVAEGTPNPIKVKATSWLSGSYEEAAKAGELWQPTITERLVMRVTGAKPYLAYGEVSIPVVETVSKTGVISGVPKGLPFTDIGWELTNAPRVGGVFITKEAMETSPKALELFFGIGQELIPFGKIQGEGEELGFRKETVKSEPIEKGLPSSMLEDSYYPKLGSFDTSLKFVDVRTLMGEGKLLPFTTQTQVTRMGIFPYVPDMAVGGASKSFGSAFLVGLGVSLVPKGFSKTMQEPKVTFEPLIKLKQPTFEEPFEIQKLKRGFSLVPAQKEKQRMVPFVTVGLGLESLTEAVSIQSPMLKAEQVQEPKQIQSLAQIQKQIQKQVQSLTSQFKTPSVQRRATTFQLPTDASLKGKGKKRIAKKRGQGVYLWEFPILDPEKVWKLK